MYINSQLKYIYLDIPRTGSSSMGTMLEDHYGGAVCRRHQWPEIWRVFPRWFLFATVRNPFDRFVSIWRFAFERRETLSDPWRKHLPSGTAEEMLIWLHAREAAVTGRGEPWTRITASQSAYLDLGKAKPEQIIRLETVHEDIKSLPFYRRGVAFPWRNSSGEKRAGEFPLSELSQDLIRQLYAEDFEQFGYSTDIKDAKE